MAALCSDRLWPCAGHWDPLDHERAREPTAASARNLPGQRRQNPPRFKSWLWALPCPSNLALQHFSVTCAQPHPGLHHRQRFHHRGANTARPALTLLLVPPHGEGPWAAALQRLPSVQAAAAAPAALPTTAARASSAPHKVLDAAVPSC